MNKEREEILEKLNGIKKKVENDLRNNHPGYENCIVKNVTHYNKTVELINKETGEKEEFDLCVATLEDPDTKKITLMYYLNGEEVDFSELMIKYESPEPIKDVVDKTRENDEKPEKEQDKEYQKQDLETLEAKDKKNEKDKEKKEELQSFHTDSSGATSLDQMIDGVTLRNLLNLDGDYKYIKPVDASKLNGFGTKISGQQGIVAIKNNGECKILGEDIIRPDRQEGNNSFDRDLNIGNDGDVEYKSNTSSYQIANKPNYYISISYDSGENEVGTTNKEIKISKRSGREGDEEVEFELQKRGSAEFEESDARKLRQENEDGIGKSEEIIKKQEEHEDFKCNNASVENIDNYENNNTHEHFEITPDTEVPGKDMTFAEWAEELGENTNEIIERFERELGKSEDIDPEKVVDTIEDDYARVGRENGKN